MQGRYTAIVSSCCWGGGEKYLRHKTTLKHTEESSCNQQSAEILYKRAANGYQAKPADQQRQVVFRSDFLQENVARHLDKHVHNVKDGGYPVEPNSDVEIEICSHALDTCIAHVCSARC